jgi:hypothetical protein
MLLLRIIIKYKLYNTVVVYIVYYYYFITEYDTNKHVYCLFIY